MRITILCEGKTEKAFKPCLNRFLRTKLAGKMPKLVFSVYDGAIPTKEKLQRRVSNLLHSGKKRSDAVIALTDVYLEFSDGNTAKRKMREWVGKEPTFYPHVALHDFEAWLLPHWDDIQNLAKRQSKPFGVRPEDVNHLNPPAYRLKKLFEAGECRDSYSKPRDAGRLLKDNDLLVSIKTCPELKAFINTIIKLCDKSKMVP